MPASNELRLFISSTFRDLQEEREHLVKKIFPEIRALCRRRGVTFTEIDLRWGLTDEDVALGQVIRACLEEVDKCRPYFIGITGNRYGYVPSYLDIQKDPALLELYPWIEEASLEEMSITEMEAHYAVLRRDEEGGIRRGVEQVRFYFRVNRADTSTDEEELQRLQEYQERIRAADLPVESFNDTEALGKMICNDLLQIIDRDFADAVPPTPLEEERARHQAFSLSRRRAYIANPKYLKRLNEHAKGDDLPLVVYAESGSGKSSLFAFWAEQYRKKNPGAHIIEHYVGIGATATDHYAIIRHVCMEIKERFNREEEIPTTPEALEKSFGQWLGYAEHALEQGDERMVLILDGLNQLQGTALALKWIPDVISSRIRFILSSTIEGTLVELRKRGWTEFGMQALSEPEREAIIVRYLAEFRKSLNPEQIRRIASDYKSGHPLFLKTLLEEIRLVNRHEDLEQGIEYYLECTGTEDLFQKVLERFEKDHGSGAVCDALSTLWCSRHGLDEQELSELTDLSRLKIAAMVSGLDYHLVRKEGYLTFFHDYLRRAVEKRYLGSEAIRRNRHLRLAEYFSEAELNKRSASERLWGYSEGGDDAKVIETLLTTQVLRELYVGAGKYEVLSQWSRLRQTGYDPEKLYVASLDDDTRKEHTSEGFDSLAIAGDILEQLGHWSGSMSMYRQMLERADEAERGMEATRALQALGRLLQLQGEYTGAMESFADALSRSEKSGDQEGVAAAVGSMGVVYFQRGEYDRAIESYQRQLTISGELDSQPGIATAIGNMGLVYMRRREYDRALESFQQCLTICEKSGDRRGIANAAGNIGILYFHHGEYDRALESFQQQLKISEELGDRRGVAFAAGNVGNVYHARDESDHALELYQRQLTICEELGERRGIVIGAGKIAIVCFERGEYDRALELNQRCLTICEELSDRIGLVAVVGNMGLVYFERGEHDRALELYQRQLTICEELGEQRGIATAFGNMSTLYIERGEYGRALESLEHALNGFQGIGMQAETVLFLQMRSDLWLKFLAFDSMPEILSKFLPGSGSRNWKSDCRDAARNDAEDSLDIAREISSVSSAFAARILLARVGDAEGETARAIAHLRAMLPEAPDDVQRADLHYRLWELSPEHRNEHRASAERLYRDLYAVTPKLEYRSRLEELDEEIGNKGEA
ncbi:MAG: tetratricopeptide repeat protein [Candidatus Kapaibacterium sp.]|nr:tetratricopeptide repeat protein [Ignavibacteria bacterium]